MALVFPSAPPIPEIVARMRVNRDMQFNNRRGAESQYPDQVIERSPPRMFAEVTTRSLDRAEYQRMRAWWESLQGGFNAMLLYDTAHPRPINYRTGFDGVLAHGGAVFDGSATVTAITPGTVTLECLPSTFDLKSGDYVGFLEGGRRSLHMVTEDVTAVDGVAALTVQPFIHTTIFTTSATALFDKPHAKFRPVTNSDSFDYGAGRGRFSFQATQIFS